MLVVFEGIDFAGKTTICKRLVYDFEATVLHGEEYKVVGNPVCDNFRKCLAKVVEAEPYLNKRGLRVMDRWVLSFLTYQKAMCPEYDVVVDALAVYLKAHFDVEPFTIYLDLGIDEFERRIQGKELDAYEQFVYTKFSEFSKAYRENAIRDDCHIIGNLERSEDEIYLDVLNALVECIENKKSWKQDYTLKWKAIHKRDSLHEKIATAKN